MTKIKHLFGLGLILVTVSNSAYAEDPSILGKEESIGSSAVSETTTGFDVSRKAIPRWDEFSFRLRGSNAVDSYSASAGGRAGPRTSSAAPSSTWNVDSGDSSGWGYGGEIRFRPLTGWWQFQGAAEHRNLTFTGMRGGNSSQVLPADAEIEVRSYEAGFVFFPFVKNGKASKLYNLGLGTLYRIETRVGNVETYPDAVVTDVRKAGLKFLLSHSLDFTDKWYLESGVSFFLPSTYIERSRATGAFSSAWTAEGRTMLGYRLTSFVQVALGVYYSRDYANFQGLGERGHPGTPSYGRYINGELIRDGVERNWHFGVPLELRFFL